MIVSEDCFVRLLDITYDELHMYKIAKTKRRIHYVAGSFGYNPDTGGTTHG